MFFVAFAQLFLITLCYYTTIKFIKSVPSIPHKLDNDYVHHKTINVVFHIIFILMMVELNGSIQNELHVLSKILNNGAHSKC
jgi:hypothetical protein